MEISTIWVVEIMQEFWNTLSTVLYNFMPEDFDLFQNLMVIGTCFGVVVWWIKR